MSNKTFLYDHHIQNGGKMIAFGGYQMPVWFSSIKDEHHCVRNSVGMFDISHMGVFLIDGENARDFLQLISCNNIQKTASGKMIYSMILNEEGMVLDDIMVGPLGESFVMVVNASNRDKLKAWFEQHLINGVTITSLEDSHGFIAVQGPAAVKTIDDLFGLSIQDLQRFGTKRLRLLDADVILMRTGYTGEDGVELVLPKESIEAIWAHLLAHGIQPCGLGARDTLRLEFGLPLYGQELSESIHPLMTRYQWVLHFEEPFIGQDALRSYKESGVSMTTVGLELKDKGIPRTGYEIVEGGYITSGTLSPSLEKPIAMAIVPVEYAELGSQLTVKIRDKELNATVVSVPFK